MSHCNECEHLSEGGFCQKHQKPLSKCAGGCTFNRSSGGSASKQTFKEMTDEDRKILRSFIDKVHCGDCLELMRKLPDNSVDVVVTSPPYNLRNSTGGSWSIPPEKREAWLRRGKNALQDGYDNYSDDMPYDEYVRWQNECLKEMVRVVKPTGFIFYNHKQRVQAGLLQHRMEIMEGIPLRQIVFWLRNGCGTINYNEGYFMNNCEQIFVIAKSNKARMPKAAYQFGLVWQIAQDTSKSDDRHPAPFPIELPDKCLDSQYLNGDSVVMDPFMGGGTTALSAIKHGIHFIGFELSQKYVDMSNRRISAALRTESERKVRSYVEDEVEKLMSQVRPKLEEVVKNRQEYKDIVSKMGLDAE